MAGHYFDGHTIRSIACKDRLGWDRLKKEGRKKEGRQMFQNSKFSGTGQVHRQMGEPVGKSEEANENVKLAASDCISVIWESAKWSAELIKLGAG